VAATPEPILQPLMSDQAIATTTIDRRTVAAFLRRAIGAVEMLPGPKLHQRLMAPAGIPLELWFDDAAEADFTVARLTDAKSDVATEAPTRLYILSSASIGEGLLPSWGDESCEAAEFHAILADAGLRAAYPFRPQEWLALDMNARVGIQLARSPADLPDWFAGAPLRQHLHWLLRARNWRIAHAATLGRDGRGILVLGHGGAGKSGTTLAGLAARLQTVGDDYVALGGIAPAVARPLFRIVKQDRAGLARIAGLTERTAHLSENWKSKVEFDAAQLFPGCFADELRIGAVVLPNVAHAPVPRITQTGAGEAMRALMRTNLYQFPGEADDGLGYYGALLRSLPVFRLELSDNAADNGAALAAFIATLS